MEFITWKYLMKIKDAVFNPKKVAQYPMLSPLKLCHSMWLSLMTEFAKDLWQSWYQRWKSMTSQ